MRRAALLLAIAAAASAHVGSPDIFLEGSAGPYPLFITIQPPPVIPGAAQIVIRSSDPDLRELRITPLPMTGEASKHPPAADLLQPSKFDPRSFTGMCWLMQIGSMQVRIQADGAKGTGLLSVPVPAVATRTKTMDRALGAGLFVMLLVLFFGVISIVGAASRESRLEPGVAVDTRHIRRGRIMMGVVSAILIAALWGGWMWWNSEADDYSLHIYRPTRMDATLGPHDRLQLQLEPPAGRVAMPDDFLPDHDHLMHLYVIRWPDFARVWHLH